MFHCLRRVPPLSLLFLSVWQPHARGNDPQGAAQLQRLPLQESQAAAHGPGKGGAHGSPRGSVMQMMSTACQAAFPELSGHAMWFASYRRVLGASESCERRRWELSDCPNLLLVGQVAARQTPMGSAPEETDPGESRGQDSSQGETTRSTISKT